MERCQEPIVELVPTTFSCRRGQGGRRDELLASGTGLPEIKGIAVCWDSTTWTRSWTIPLTTTIPGIFGVSRDDSMLVATCHIGDAVEVWDLINRQHLRTLPLMPESPGKTKSGLPRDSTVVGALEFSENGALLIAGCWDCCIKLWTVDTGELREKEISRYNIDIVTFVDNERSILAGTAHSVMWLDPDDLSLMGSRRLPDDCWKHCVSQDKRYLASVSHSGALIFLDLLDGTVFEHLLHTEVPTSRAYNATSLAWTRDSRLLAVGCDDGLVLLWGVESRRLLARWRAAKTSITSLSFARGGNRLAVAFGVAKLGVVVYDIDAIAA